jgi:carbamoylphosphate synthase small subunit
MKKRTPSASVARKGKNGQETDHHDRSGNHRDHGQKLDDLILGLAGGASTYKLKFGHRSHNQPCIEIGTNRCYITSQNHGYAVDADTLPEDWREWFYNNNDETNEGIKHISKPFLVTNDIVFNPNATHSRNVESRFYSEDMSNLQDIISVEREIWFFTNR